MICSFIGHRDSVNVEERVYEEIKKLISEGVTEFYSGGMGNFDKICGKIVKKLRGKITFIPYNDKQVKIWDKLFYDDIISPLKNKIYEKSDIPKRNEWLVEHCDIFICNVYKNSGGAKRTYDYALKKNKKIINI